jgi:hypothetical protein
MKAVQGCTKREAVAANRKFTDRVFMRAGSLFDDGNGTPNSARGLKEAQ